jgi:hypothetical protein
VQPTKFDYVIYLKAAKASSLVGLADEVIE